MFFMRKTRFVRDKVARFLLGNKKARESLAKYQKRSSNNLLDERFFYYYSKKQSKSQRNEYKKYKKRLVFRKIRTVMRIVVRFCSSNRLLDEQNAKSPSVSGRKERLRVG